MKLNKLRGLACIFLALNCFAILKANAGSSIIIVAQPTNQISAIFGSATFSVSAESALPLNYQWVFNGEPIAAATNADLILGPLNCAQNGYYSVIVSNSDGALSSSKAQLVVYQTIASGFNPNHTSGYLPGAQDFLLQFTNVMVASIGSFALYALNSDGNVVGYDTADSDSGVPAQDLVVPSGLSDVVAISSGPTAVLALRGNGTVAAWGDGPTNFPSGLSDVTAVAVGNQYSFALRSNATVVVWPSNVVNLSQWSNVVAITASPFQFLALNADGTVVEWYYEGQPQLVSGLSNVIAIATGGASLALKADGTMTGFDHEATNPLPNVSNVVAMALSDNLAIPGGSSFLALKADGTVASAEIQTPLYSFPVALSNVCAVAVSVNLGGIAMVSNGAPVFTVQPGNQFPTNGGAIWLHARAVGAQPMNYQWQLNGTDISGATNSDLTITNTQDLNIGQYSALASNSLGSASSRLASISVATRPPQVPSTLMQALEATNLTWLTFGNAMWFPEATNTHDGFAAAQSGRITNSMMTDLRTYVTGPGTLAFWWKVSSEEFFDTLSFSIGAVTNVAASISGEVDWEQESFPIGPGSQPLTWIYSKDPDVSVGLDAGWVAQVSFKPSVPAQLGVPTFLANGSLVFDVYTTNGSVLGLNDPSSVLLEASSNLVDWIPLTNGLILTNGSALLSDPAVSNSLVRFYRLLRQ